MPPRCQNYIDEEFESDNDLQDYENKCDFEDDFIQGVDLDQSHESLKLD